MSPHELYFGKKPNLAHLRVFGSIAYVHVPKEKRKKLDATVEKCILVSYLDKQKGYKCYNPRMKEVQVSRNVIFDESASWYLPPSPTPINSIPNSEDVASEAEIPLDEEEIRALEESSISFLVSGTNEGLSQNGQPDTEPASSGDSVV